MCIFIYLCVCACVCFWEYRYRHMLSMKCMQSSETLLYVASDLYLSKKNRSLCFSPLQLPGLVSFWGFSFSFSISPQDLGYCRHTQPGLAWSRWGPSSSPHPYTASAFPLHDLSSPSVFILKPQNIKRVTRVESSRKRYLAKSALEAATNMVPTTPVEMLFKISYFKLFQNGYYTFTFLVGKLF